MTRTESPTNISKDGYDELLGIMRQTQMSNDLPVDLTPQQIKSGGGTGFKAIKTLGETIRLPLKIDDTSLRLDTINREFSALNPDLPTAKQSQRSFRVKEENPVPRVSITIPPARENQVTKPSNQNSYSQLDQSKYQPFMSNKQSQQQLSKFVSITDLSPKPS